MTIADCVRCATMWPWDGVKHFAPAGSRNIAMPYDPRKHHRRSIRLPGYDYTQAGAYFVTLVTHERACLFGEIVDGEMRLNEAGQAAERCWLDIPSHFPHAALDAFVIMPNHVHGILWIVETPAGAMGPGETGVGAKNFSPLRPPPSSSVSPPDQPSSRPAATHTLPGGPSPSAGLPRGTSRTIGSIVRGFKIGVTKWFRQNTSRGVAWQRNYYEHIIRDETSLRQIREYIVANPQRWSLDHENPDNLTR